MKTKINITPKTRTIRSWKHDTHVKLDTVTKNLSVTRSTRSRTGLTLNLTANRLPFPTMVGIQNISDALAWVEVTIPATGDLGEMV